MQIIPVHYTPSSEVYSYSSIARSAGMMADMIDCKDFKGQHEAAYALAHAQVSYSPSSFFVLDRQLVQGMGEDESMAVFEDRVIINPKIIEAPIYYVKRPRWSLFRKNDEYDGKMIAGKKPNYAAYFEGCMSFPYRKSKRINRFDKILVSYQVNGRFGLRKVKKWLSGIPSQVFQHEYDHCQGKNIYFEDYA